MNDFTADISRSEQVTAEAQAAREALAGNASKARENRALDRLVMDAMGMSKLAEAMAKPPVKKKGGAQ